MATPVTVSESAIRRWARPMFRYAALIWWHDDAHCASAARFAALQFQQARWNDVTSVPGLRVFEKGSRRGSIEAQVLPGAAGVVVGTVFHRRPDPATRTWRSLTPQIVLEPGCVVSAIILMACACCP